MSAVQAVNLVSAARRQARQRRQRIARWTGGVAIYALALIALWMGTHVVWTGTQRSLASQLDQAEQRIDQTRQRMQELRPELAEARTTLAASRAVGNQPDWSLLLSLLSKLLDERTVLTGVKLEPKTDGPPMPGHADDGPTDARFTAAGPFVLRISGLGRSQSAVSDYVLRLEDTALFEQVTLIDTHPEPFRDQEAVGFRIRCQLGERQEATPDGAASDSAEDGEGGGP